jgi:hypothetical protein
MPTSDSWYSWSQLFGTAKILLLYILFALAIAVIGGLLLPGGSDDSNDDCGGSPDYLFCR